MLTAFLIMFGISAILDGLFLYVHLNSSRYMCGYYKKNTIKIYQIILIVMSTFIPVVNVSISIIGFGYTLFNIFDDDIKHKSKIINWLNKKV